MVTIISVAPFAESGYFLAICDHGLKDLLWVEVPFGQGMLQSYSISAADLMIFITHSLQ
jgi:hypothetical protein